MNEQKEMELPAEHEWMGMGSRDGKRQASVCFLVFVSSQQRFGVTKKPPRRVTVLDRPCYSSQVSNGPLERLNKSVLQFSVTALFYLEDSRKIHLRGGRARGSKDAKRRGPQRAGEREREPFGSSFYVFFSFPEACPMQIGLSQELCST